MYIFSEAVYTVNNQLRTSCAEICPEEYLRGLLIWGVMKPGAMGHIFYAVTLSCALSVIGLDLGAIGIALIIFGSLLPDVDHRSSTLGRFNVINRLRLTKHRGKCHTLIGSILLCVPFYITGGSLTFLWVFLGCVSHLCADKLHSFGKRKKPFAIKLW